MYGQDYYSGVTTAGVHGCMPGLTGRKKKLLSHVKSVSGNMSFSHDWTQDFFSNVAGTLLLSPAITCLCFPLSWFHSQTDL